MFGRKPKSSNGVPDDCVTLDVVLAKGFKEFTPSPDFYVTYGPEGRANHMYIKAGEAEQKHGPPIDYYRYMG
jgi:hypothetical protein